MVARAFVVAAAVVEGSLVRSQGRPGDGVGVATPPEGVETEVGTMVDEGVAVSQGLGRPSPGVVDGLGVVA